MALKAKVTESVDEGILEMDAVFALPATMKISDIYALMESIETLVVTAGGEVMEGNWAVRAELLA